MELSRNAPCSCGSGKKYKHCCLPKGVKPSPAASVGAVGVRGRFSLAVVLCLALLGALIYSNTLNAPFTFDDAILEQQRERHDVNSLKDIVGRQRPVSYLSFDFNYYLAGEDPFVYHLTNIVIHVLAAVCFYFFLYHTLLLPSLRDRYGGAAGEISALAAFLFLAHPVQTQAVSYIIQRMTSLAALFYFLSLLLYIKGRLCENKGRGALFYGAALLAGLLSLGSKQHTVTLPLIIILYEFFFFQGLDLGRFRRYLPSLAAALLLPVLVGILFVQDLNWLLKGYDQYKFTMGEKTLTEFRVLVYYLSLLVLPLPSRLNLDYDYSISTSLVSPPSTLISLVFLLALLAFACLRARKSPLISFALLWYFITLALESFLLPIEIIYEHRLYLPAAGFFIPAAVFLFSLPEGGPGGAVTRPRTALALVVLLFLSWGTYERNKVWENEISLWSDVVKKSPQKARPHNNLGKAYASAGLAASDPRLAGEYAAKAIEEYTKAVTLNPANYVAFDNLGQSYGRKDMTDEAIKACLQAVRLKPDYLPAHNNLGVAYNRKKMYKEAEVHCLKALEINPRYAKAHFNLGRAYDGQGRYDEAIASFKRAFELQPEDANIPYNMGNTYFNQGKNRRAAEYYELALRMNSNFLNAYYNLGVIYYNKGDYRKALAQYEKMLQLNPRHAPAHERMGLIYFHKIQNPRRALYHFQEAAAHAPGKKEAVLAKKLAEKLRARGVTADSPVFAR